jgi:hypothetical protein
MADHPMPSPLLWPVSATTSTATSTTSSSTAASAGIGHGCAPSDASTDEGLGSTDDGRASAETDGRAAAQ